MRDFVFRSRWGVLDYAQLAVILALLLYWTAGRWVGTVEGALFPVVSPVVLSEPRQSPPPAYRHTWLGEAEKHRDCDFVRMKWFLGQPQERRVQVSSSFTDAPTIRGPGHLVWEGIVIALEPDEVTANSHAYVYHKCGWRPWLTVSRFYDSRAD